MFQLLYQREKKDSDQTSDTSAINLERVGRSRIDDLVSSSREVPWFLTIAQLLWTAGPVTFLALQVGSLMGYGEPVEVTTYIFFAIYVIVAALIGIMARIFSKLIRGQKQDQKRQQITRTLDIIPDLMFTVRDLNLSSMTKARRRRAAAAILLRKQDLGPNTISVAVEDLTRDASLGVIAQQIEVFRRDGMFSRIHDLNRTNKDHITAALENVRRYSSDIAEVLELRLQGVAPSQDEGVQRGENFISQIYSAAHQEDLSLMTLSDVEYVLQLSFELLSGREITRLIIDYEGDWQMARALDELERCHNDFRQIKASAVLYLRDLTHFLIQSGLTPLKQETLDQDMDTLLNETSTALTRLVARLRWSGQSELDAHPDIRQNLRMALRYAKLTRQAIGRLEDRYVRYVRALERWTLLRERLLSEDRQGPGGGGLRIRESSIALTDEQKLEFASQFCRYLDDHRIASGEKGILRHGATIGTAHAKHLGIRLVLILQPLIALDNPSVQRAVESSRGAYLEGLEMGFSADAKAGLGTAVVKELKEDLGSAAELIALRLTKLYRMPLSDHVVDFLSSHYGANRERLKFLADSTEQADTEDNTPPIPHEPSMINHYQQWRTPIEAAEGLLARLLR